MGAADVKTVSCPLMSSISICVAAEVNWEPVHCLLDSGCERSDIAHNLALHATMTLSRYTLSATNCMDLPILGDADFQFTIDGHKFVANVFVLPDIDEFLL